jgi:hypothetical protein
MYNKNINIRLGGNDTLEHERYLDTAALLQLRPSTNDAIQTTLELVMEIYKRRGFASQIDKIEIATSSNPTNAIFKELAELVASITMLGETGKWRQLMHPTRG